MHMRYQNYSGIVLRRYTLPSSDIVLHIFTPRGKIRLIARGGARGQDCSKLNLFQHVSVQTYTQPNQDLLRLTQVTLEGALPKLSEPQLYPYAHLIAELTDQLSLENEQAEHTFELLASALRGLCFHPDPAWVAWVMFGKLLGFSGFMPRLARCPHLQALPSVDDWPDTVYFVAEHGDICCKTCGSGLILSAEAASYLLTFYQHTVRQLMERPLPNPQRPSLWRIWEAYSRLHVAELRAWSSLRHLHHHNPSKAPKVPSPK